MSLAAVLISIIALILTTTLCVTIAVLVSKALSNAFRALDSMHSRHAEQQKELLDRFMTIRWEDLVALRSNETEEEGGFFEQDEEPGEVQQERPWPRWDLSASTEPDETTEDEQALIDEDFDEMGAPRR